MGQNRKARRKAGAEQRDAEERKRFEEFLRQVHLEGDSPIGAYATTYGEVVFDGESVSCEGFSGPCDAKTAEKRTAMTAYHWDGNGENPNRPPTLCATCWESYKAYWNEKWAEVRSGTGV